MLAYISVFIFASQLRAISHLLGSNFDLFKKVNAINALCLLISQIKIIATMDVKKENNFLNVY